MATFPKFFKHMPLEGRYQLLLLMNEESAPGVIMTFQHEVYSYAPDDTEAQNALFHYQPDMLLSCQTAVMPALAVLRNDPAWVEGKMLWSEINAIGVGASSDRSTPTSSVLTVDGVQAVAEDDAEELVTNLYFV